MKGLVLDTVWDPKPDYQISEWERKTGKAITGNSIWRNPKLEVRDWPDPEPGPQDVVLEVQACKVPHHPGPRVLRQGRGEWTLLPSPPNAQMARSWSSPMRRGRQTH